MTRNLLILVLVARQHYFKKGAGVMDKEFGLNDVVQMKKPHPCGENRWKIIRMGMDIRIKCLGCGHSVLIPRKDFTKKLKKVLEKHEE